MRHFDFARDQKRINLEIEGDNMSKIRRTTLFVATVTVLMTLLVGTAYAVQTFRAGGATSRQYLVTQTNAWDVPSTGVWTTVPSASVSVTVPNFTQRVISVRFSAESLCAGSGWCSVRIVYNRLPSGGLVELAPQSNTDFAFDSAGDSWSAHTVERSTATFLPAGTYSVRVQAQRVGASQFRLDDYHTNISLINP